MNDGRRDIDGRLMLLLRDIIGLPMEERPYRLPCACSHFHDEPVNTERHRRGCAGRHLHDPIRSPEPERYYRTTVGALLMPPPLCAHQPCYFGSGSDYCRDIS